MDFDIAQEIRAIVHGLGERKQRKDTMSVIQSVVFNQMAMLISQTHDKNEITVKNVVYVLRNYKHTLIRMMKYYWFKENIHKLTTAADIEGPCEKYMLEQSRMSEAKRVKLCNNFYKDIAHKPSIFDVYITTNLDPINTLAKNYDITSSLIKKSGKNKGVYNSIKNAIKELNLDMNIVTDVTISNVSTNTDARQIRINELATLLSPNAYKSFHICRRQNFHNKTGNLLLNEVFQALTIDVTITSQVREIFLFLAKETIACLIDRVYEIRKKYIATEPDPIQSESTYIHKKNESSKIQKHEPLLVDEIIAATTITWNRPLNDICIPFDVNDAFLKSRLILD